MKLRRIFLFWIPFAICNLSCSSSNIDPMPANNLKPGWHKGSLQHDDLKRDFLFYVPKNLTDNPPAVLLLHGGTQSMNELFRKNAGGTKAWPKVAEEKGFLLLVPNGTNILSGSPTGNYQQWNDCREIGSHVDDVGFIAELIAWTDNKVNIDTNRVYATGISNGGLMTYRLASELEDKIAAITVFIANKPDNSPCSDPAQSVPVMIVNGTEDSIMPYNGGEVSNGNRGSVLSTAETVDYWTQQYGIPTEPIAIDTLQNKNNNDESQIVRFRYGSPELGAPVVLYKIVGGGHLMPSVQHVVPHWIEQLLGQQNNDVEGAHIAWKFFSQHTR